MKASEPRKEPQKVMRANASKLATCSCTKGSVVQDHSSSSKSTNPCMAGKGMTQSQAQSSCTCQLRHPQEASYSFPLHLG